MPGGTKLVMNPFNEDYFERGVETETSLYQNYRWIPEMTIPMVMTMIDHLHIERGAKILDFGCAKGYVVRAFNLLYRKAWGVDISEYAISESSDHCYLKKGNVVLDVPPHFPTMFDYCIAKDVFEHIGLSDIRQELDWLLGVTKTLFAIIPLGDGVHYDCPANDRDKTHILAHGKHWWISLFTEIGWEVVSFNHKIEGIKNSYYEAYPKAHGFFTLIKKSD